MHQASGNSHDPHGPSPGDGRGTRLTFTTSLPSTYDGLGFSVRITARWRAGARQMDRETLRAHVRAAIRTEAAKLTRAHSVLDPQAARDTLVIRLSQWHGVPTVSSLFWRLTAAKVAVGDKQREHALHHKLALAEEQARIERSHTKVVALRKIMTDRGSLYAWWLQHVPLADPPDANTFDALRRIAEDVAKLPPPRDPASEPWLAELAAWFWAELTSTERSLVLNQLSRLAHLLNRPEMAHRLAAFQVEDPEGHIQGNGAASAANTSAPSTAGEHRIAT